jgi:hypothetical protein
MSEVTSQLVMLRVVRRFNRELRTEVQEAKTTVSLPAPDSRTAANGPLFGSSHKISKNRAIPLATADFILAFRGAQTSPQQEGIACA